MTILITTQVGRNLYNTYMAKSLNHAIDGSMLEVDGLAYPSTCPYRSNSSFGSREMLIEPLSLHRQL